MSVKNHFLERLLTWTKAIQQIESSQSDEVYSTWFPLKTFIQMGVFRGNFYFYLTTGCTADSTSAQNKETRYYCFEPILNQCGFFSFFLCRLHSVLVDQLDILQFAKLKPSPLKQVVRCLQYFFSNQRKNTRYTQVSLCSLKTCCLLPQLHH